MDRQRDEETRAPGSPHEQRGAPRAPADAGPEDRPDADRDEVEEASEESFPASDPPTWSHLHSGTPERPA